MIEASKQEGYDEGNALTEAWYDRIWKIAIHKD
jgi:hypothetical protein